MSINFDYSPQRTIRLAVVGVGGGGCNAVDDMIERGLEAVDFIAINTDAQVLKKNLAQHKIQAGRTLTHGWGAGGDPSRGLRAVEESKEEIASVLADRDLVFVTAGMGGGTGTGGAPGVASIARAAGALVVGIVTKPFDFEGRQRMNLAMEGLDELRKHVDTLIVVPNQKLLSLMDKNVPIQQSFMFANEILYNAVRGISETLTQVGMINEEFADVRMVIKDAGEALIGCGYGSGEDRAIQAVHAALEHPLLDDVSVAGADAVLVNVSGSSSLGLAEVSEIMEYIESKVGDQAHIVQGIMVNEALEDRLEVTIIAAGFNRKQAVVRPRPASRAAEPISPFTLHSRFGESEPADVTQSDFKRRTGAFSPDRLRTPFSPEDDAEDAKRKDYDVPTVIRRLSEQGNISS